MRRSLLALSATLLGLTIGVGGHSLPAHADTPADTIYGEGGDATTPIMLKLLKDDAAQLNPEFGSYTNVGLDSGIADFIGSAPNTFAADYAVTERQLTSAEAATAKSNGRTFAYVPFAAVPVALMTLVPQPTFQGNGSINPAQYCQHIPLNLTQLDGIYGAPTLANWGDPSLACSIGGSPPDAVPFIPWANLDNTMENYSLMNLLDSTTASQGIFQAGLTKGVTTSKATTSDTAPSEVWPYSSNSVPGGDREVHSLESKMIGINPTTNLPSTQTAEISLGGIVAMSSVWTGDPLGPHWNLPTAAVQNAQGAYVAPSEAAAAAESEGMPPWRQRPIRPPTTWSHFRCQSDRCGGVQQLPDDGELSRRSDQWAGCDQSARPGPVHPVRTGHDRAEGHLLARSRSRHAGHGEHWTGDRSDSGRRGGHQHVDWQHHNDDSGVIKHNNNNDGDNRCRHRRKAIVGGWYDHLGSRIDR